MLNLLTNIEKMKKSILLGLFLMTMIGISEAQNFLNAYTDQNQTGYLGFINRIATDPFNNVVNTSTFSGTFSVGAQSFSSQGALSAIIIKRDDNGSLLWAKALSCNGTTVIGGVYIDNQSNVYVSGFFGDTLMATQLNCQPFPISNPVGIRAFVVKYAPNGNVLWSNSFACSTSGASGNADLYRITGNGSNRIAVSAAFENVGAQNIGSSTVSTSAGNVVIAFADDNGNWINAKVLTGSNNTQLSMSLAMNSSGELFLGGVFRGSMNLDAAGIITSPPTDLNDYIIKMNPSGDFEWAHNLPSGSWWRTEVMTYQNDVFLTGSFGGNVTIGGTSLSASYFSTYLTRLDNSGNFLWAKKYGDSETNMYCAGIHQNQLFICGYTLSSVTSNQFDTYQMVYANTLPAGINTGSKAYLIKLDINGTVLNGACYGFNFSTMNTMGITASNNKIYLTGNAGSTARFGGHTVNAAQINGSNYVAIYTDSTNLITGSSYYDANGNSLFDAGEITCPVNLTLNNGSSTSQTLINGDYVIGVGTGTFTTALINPPVYYTINPTGYTSTFQTLSSQVDSNRNFAFQPIPNQSDLVIDLVTGFFRPGFNGFAFVTLNNIGTTSQTGNIDLLFNHPDISINSINPLAASVNGNSAVMSYSLLPGESISFLISYYVSVTAQLGANFVSSVAAINANDLTPGNNSIQLNSTITGSYDPNIKVVSNTNIFQSFIANGEYLEYTVFFQNTGNDTAFTVLIIDTLSTLLDMSTLQIISNSHPMVVNNYDGVLWFRFNNILLPDSNTNEPASHGYVKYKIKPISTMNIGDQILNTAYIYFDFNAPIITNTTSTALTTLSSISAASKAKTLHIFPNPASNEIIQVWAEEKIQHVALFDLSGRLLVSEPGKGSDVFKFNAEVLAKGSYLMRITGSEHVFEQKLIKY